MFFTATAAFLFLTVVGGLWRVIRGPDPGDRLMAAQLFGTTAAAIMLLLAETEEGAGLRYLALMFAALAVVVVVAYVRLVWPGDSVEEEP